MDTKKYDKLINLIINEDQESAQELFHEIVVEQSRKIYESIMEEEMMDSDDGIGGDVGDLLDEITAEESGCNEDEEVEEDYHVSEEDEEDEDVDMLDMSDVDSESDDTAEEVEDAVVRIEDKLDQLMAEFEEILGSQDSEDMDDVEADEVEVDVTGDEDEDEDESEDEMMQEAVQLQKVQTSHGDNGDQTKSPVAADSGKTGMDSKPVDFAGGDEKGRSAPQTKDLKGAGTFKNSPGGKAKVDLASAPKPMKTDSAGNSKSPVAK